MRSHVLLSGAMGSGKTWAAVGALLLHAWRWHGLPYAAVATSAAQWESVIAGTIDRQLDLWGLPMLRRRRDWWEIPAPPGGRPSRLYRLLAGNRTAARRLKGHTLAGVLIDELTEMPDAEYVRLVWSRVRDPRCADPLVLMTTNPAGPDHWAVTDIAEPIRRGKVAGSVQLWLPADNPAMTAEALADLHATYPAGTVGHRRYILGEWVAQDGAVYPTGLIDAAQCRPPGRQPEAYAVSVDVGYASDTHAVLWAGWAGGWVAVDEWVYSGQDDRQMVAADQVRSALTRFRMSWPEMPRRLRLVIVDPSPGGPEGWLRSARSFLRRSQARVVPADKTSLLSGIELTRRWLATGRMRFGPEVPKLVYALRRYHWAQPTVTGVERPVQIDDHGPDAARYLAQTVDRMERRSGGVYDLTPQAGPPPRPQAGDVEYARPL